MKYYVFAEMEVTDPAWVGEYVKEVTPMIERYGGRYLARTPRVEKLEGDRPQPKLVLLVEWPSREAALAFFQSEEYRPYRESRGAGATNEFMLIAGEDITGAARIAEG